MRLCNFVLAVLLCTGSASGSPILYVDCSRPDSGGDGSSWQAAFRFLQDALTHARSSQTSVSEIRIADGICRPDQSVSSPLGTRNRLATFTFVDGVSIIGGFAGSDGIAGATILSADLLGNDVAENAASKNDNAFHVLTASPGASTATVLRNVTVADGNASGIEQHSRGGGLLVYWSADIRVEDCLFVGNQATDDGGAVWSQSNRPVFTRCSFVENSAGDFGGGAYSDASRPVYADCTFEQNRSRRGGALSSYFSPPEIDRCSFSDNTAVEFGGAAYFRSSGGVSIRSSLFAGNSSGLRGGALSGEGSTQLLVINSTFTQNSPQAVFTSNWTMSTQLNNCILWGNGSADVLVWNDSPVTINSSLLQYQWTGSGSNNIVSDPAFEGATRGNYRLLHDSPAIDAGNSSWWTSSPQALDLDGESRIFGDGVDLGAYEYYPLALDIIECVSAGDCDDGNVCTVDSCVDAGCVYAFSSESCTDGNACTTGDHCSVGQCVSGATITCNDNNACTRDTCSPATGCAFTADNTLTWSDGNPCTTESCVNGTPTPVFNTAACNDGNACTSNDRCALGVCAGSTVTCNDGNACTDDSCNPATGCVYLADNSNACNDNNACTTGDHCSAGQCVGAGTVTCNDSNPCTDDTCNASTGCVFTVDNTNACTDGNFCNGVETCSGGSCVSGTPPVCNDGKPCTDDSCHPATGCVYTNDNSNTCSDGNVCNGAEICSNGNCLAGASLVCNDNKPCTDDSCHPTLGCTYTNDNTNTCSDGSACTVSDRCLNGQCIGTALSCSDNNPCTQDSCNPATGCTFLVTSGCDCTSNADCNDGNPCTTDVCTPSFECQYTNNTSACNDNNACTTNDVCSGGTCAGLTAVVCNDGNPCTDDACLPTIGCTYTSDNSNSCSDGNACNGAEFCANGTCRAGVALVCNDGNPCTDDSCSAAVGCVYAIDNTNSCSDANVCTGSDRCLNGTCIGTPVVCNDNNVCTDDACIAGQGCVSTPDDSNNCDDGDLCNGRETCAGGICRSGAPLTCEDNDSCTDDTCSDGQCQHENTCECVTDADCDDSDAGTLDYCEDGACQYDAAVDVCECFSAADCDDGDPCTLDACDCSCSHSVVAVCCGDLICGVDESSCNCALDCGVPLLRELPGNSCQDGIDNDCDGQVDCADADCGKDARCWTCNRNGICDAGETCKTCPSDCAGESAGRRAYRFCCGNGIREANEDGGVCDGNY